MPKGTRVSRCVEKIKKQGKDEGTAIAICQDSTNQGYATGRKLKEDSSASPAMKQLMKRTAEIKEKKRIAALMKANKPQKVDEAAPLVSAAARVIGSRLLRKGAVAAGRGAAQGTTRRTIATGARNLAKNPKAVQAMGTAAEQGFEALKAQRASDKDLEETKMNNAYINKLMETRSPESRARTKGRKEFGTPGRKGKLTDKTPAEIVARGLGQRAAEDIGRARTRETAAKDIDTHHNVPSGPEASKSLRSHARKLRKSAGEKITRGKQEVFAKRSEKRKAAEQQNAWTEYQKIGALMAEAMGLVEGKTTGADPRATGARVQRGAEAAEKAGKKSKEDIHRQVLRIKAKVGAKHSDTGSLKPEKRSFGNQGGSLEDKQKKVRQTTRERNKARREFVRGQRSAESPEATEKRQEGDKQTARDLKAAVSRFPAGRKP